VTANYIPVIEKITTRDGKEKTIEWKGRILNVPGFKTTDTSRDVVENTIRARLKTVLFNKTED
jgi:hypothetical protein